MSTPKVFISYSQSDREWARKFAEAVLSCGIEIWFDQFELKPGDHLQLKIEEGFRKSDVVVLLVQPENANQPNLFFEIGAALGMDKKIIPVVPEEFEYKKFPSFLQRIQSLVRKSPEETAEELATALKSLYGEAA